MIEALLNNRGALLVDARALLVNGTALLSDNMARFLAGAWYDIFGCKYVSGYIGLF